MAEGVAEHAMEHGLAGAAKHDAEHAAEENAARDLTQDAKGSTKEAVEDCNSFDPHTPVATPDGATPIGQLQVGDNVTAYDPATGKTKAETVEHVFIHHDTNLLDVTMAPLANPTATVVSPDDAISPKQARAALASHGLRAPPTETLHTTTEHPFLTTDRGFVTAQDLHIGERVQRLDGRIGVVVAVTSTPGDAVRYNLTVHELHTYAVGTGLWVVHNVDVCHFPNFDAARRDAFEKAGMTDPEKIRITQIDPQTGTAVEFEGPGGAKVAYDAPHADMDPSLGHDKPHVGWQSAGKRGEGGGMRGNNTYDGPQHPFRSPVKGIGTTDE